MSTTPIAPASALNSQVIVEGLMQARLQVDSFEAMYASVGTINGILELLAHLIEQMSERGGPEVDWNVIHHAVADAAARCANVYSASGYLMKLERDAKLADSEVHPDLHPSVRRAARREGAR